MGRYDLNDTCSFDCCIPPPPPSTALNAPSHTCPAVDCSFRLAKINVEANQLDPLLRDVNGKGDVNDEETGFSPYPGNINQLVLALEPYCKVGKQKQI